MDAGVKRSKVLGVGGYQVKGIWGMVCKYYGVVRKGYKC